MARLRTLRPGAALLAALGLALALPGAAFAQAAETGVLEGRVVLPNGRPAPDANVTLLGPNFYQTRVTDAGGSYRFESLPPGAYSVEAVGTGDSAGYDSMDQVTIRPGGWTRLDLRLTTPPPSAPGGPAEPPPPASAEPDAPAP